MNTYKTAGIILRQQNYNEADRIYTIITPIGKLSAIAKGVRRIQAKLSSQLELFSEIELMLVRGKNLDIVTSARSHTRYDLVEDYERLRRGFLFLEMVNKLSDTEDTNEIFDCLKSGLSSLQIGSPMVAELAFKLKLLQVLGHAPRLDIQGNDNLAVTEGKAYSFDVEQGVLIDRRAGLNRLEPDMIKLWRLCLRHDIEKVCSIKNAEVAASGSLGVCDRFYEYLFDKRFVSSQI